MSSLVFPRLAVNEMRKMLSRHIKQEVCPWNSPKLVQATSERDYLTRGSGPSGGAPGTGTHAHSHSHGGPATEGPSLIELLEMALDEAAWDAFSRGSAIHRAGRAGFARNICVGLGNWGSPEAVPTLALALSDPEPLVRAHAAWALGRVGSVEARSAMTARTAVESDSAVRAELAAALGP